MEIVRHIKNRQKEKKNFLKDNLKASRYISNSPKKNINNQSMANMSQRGKTKQTNSVYGMRDPSNERSIQ